MSDHSGSGEPGSGQDSSPMEQVQGEGARALLSSFTERNRGPLSATMAVTERCNVRCQHCFLQGAKVRQELTTAQWLGVFDHLKESGVLFAMITGGEPTLRQDLPELVRGLAARRFSLLVKTNGIFLEAEDIDALVASGLRNVDLSYHSNDPAFFDAFVDVPGAHARVVENARRFVDAGVRVHLSMVATALNVAELPAMLDFCEGMGASYKVDLQVRCASTGCTSQYGLLADEARVAEILQDPRLERELDRAVTRRSPDSRFCSAGTMGTFIAPNGDVQLCQAMTEVIGNVLDTPLREILAGSAAIESFNALRWGQLAECSVCDIAWACSRCPANALNEHGDILGKSVSDCANAHYIAAAHRLRAERSGNK